MALAVPALILDGVDGWVARRTGTANDAGARLDMEVDAALILVLRKSIPWPDDLLAVPAPVRTSVSVAGYLIEPAPLGARITRFGTVRLGTSVSLQMRKNIAKTAAKILPKLKQHHNSQRRK